MIISLSVIKYAIILSVLPVPQVRCFWDIATTTLGHERKDDTPRRGFFRWQWVATTESKFWWPSWDWDEIWYRRRLNRMAGISIDFLCLSTGVILNRRMIVTAYNHLDPHMTRQYDVRIWCLGRTGLHYTPYRYRAYKILRVLPKSLNPEHCHGPRCVHSPRHDVAIIWTLDQMYIYYTEPGRYHYAYRAKFHSEKLSRTDLWFAGSGFEYPQHVVENYKIFYAKVRIGDIIDCSIILPKWWGKFFCLRNYKHVSGVQNGGGFFSGWDVVGIGCFEIRYNDNRYFVFTDLRYYAKRIYNNLMIRAGQYYEYAYPQWGIKLGMLYDGGSNYPYIPKWQVQDDIRIY